jgi:hypothetical protein
MKSVLSALFVLTFLGSAAIAASHGDSAAELQGQIDKQNLEVVLPEGLTDDQLRDIKTILTGTDDAAKKSTMIKAVLGM